MSGVRSFLSTPSARRATKITFADLGWYEVFLSTPSARRATIDTGIKPFETVFLSTPSVRRATGAAQAAQRGILYFYPRPP